MNAVFLDLKLQSSNNIDRAIISRGGYVTRMDETNHACKLLTEAYKCMRTLGRLKLRWDDTIKTYIM